MPLMYTNGSVNAERLSYAEECLRCAFNGLAAANAAADNGPFPLQGSPHGVYEHFHQAAKAAMRALYGESVGDMAYDAYTASYAGEEFRLDWLNEIVRQALASHINEKADYVRLMVGNNDFRFIYSEIAQHNEWAEMLGVSAIRLSVTLA